MRDKAQDVKHDVQSMGQTAGDAARRSADQLRDKAGDLKQDTMALGTAAKEAVQEQFGNLRDTAGQYYEQGRQRASEMVEQGTHRARELEYTFEDKVRQQPITSVAVAAGVGFILGLMWNRR
jgi:ElaB/YqjD/DUF883 family membrane-anchored ribosome-binding protein